MDVLYVLGNDPIHNYTELRYSIRSMQRHVADLGRLFIVGEDPGFLKHFYRIPCNDIERNNNNLNIYNKILTACHSSELGDEFLCCSDDQFLLSDFMGSTFPYFYRGDIAESVAKISDKSFKSSLENTYNALKERGLPSYNFDIHTPFKYNKKLFLSLMPLNDWTLKKAFVSKSLYANSLKIEGVLSDDGKIHTPKTATAIRRRLKGAKIFSTNEHSFNDPMKAFLHELFPGPSSWEA